MNTFRILIVGAGISGLSTALALRRQGFSRIEVFERAAELTEVGAGIQLAPNAVRVLHSLGLAEKLRQSADCAAWGWIRDGESNRLLGRLPYSDYSEKRYGFPSYQILRADLHRILLDEVSQSGVSIHTGMAVSGYQPTGEGIQLSLQTAGPVQADLVIAADGIGSVLADQMHGDCLPFYSGYACWRALVDRSEAEGLMPPDSADKVTAWIGSGKHMIAYPVGHGDKLNIVAVHARPDWPHPSRSLASSASDWRAAYADWSPDVTQVLGLVKDVQLWGLFERAKLPNWYQNRCQLIGDAAHPMLPSLAQGAAQGIEDGALLAQLLAEQARIAPLRQNLDDCCERFFQLRRERVVRVQDSAHWNMNYFHQPKGLIRHCRDLAMRLSGPIATGLIARRYHWLYQKP